MDLEQLGEWGQRLVWWSPEEGQYLPHPEHHYVLQYDQWLREAIEGWAWIDWGQVDVLSGLG